MSYSSGASAEYFQGSWNPKLARFKVCFEGRPDGRQAATCCFGLRKRLIMEKGLRKVGKAQVRHAFECQIKEFESFKEFHEVILI